MFSRPISALSCLLLAVGWISAEPLSFTVIFNGAKVGTVTRETTGSDADGYSEENTMKLSQSGKLYSFHEVDRFDRNGVISSKIEEETTPDGMVAKKAVLGADGARVSVVTNGISSERIVPIASKTTRANPFYFWFKKVQPTVGSALTVQSFHLDTSKWGDETVKFIGKKQITISGKSVMANEVEITEGADKHEEYFDDQHNLVLVSLGQMRIERVF